MTEVLLGLGSNLRPKQNLQQAIVALAPDISVLNTSAWYESEALDKSSPNYLNLVLQCSTDLDLDRLLKKFKRIEFSAGRTPESKACPLDIDILTYGSFVGQHGKNRIPREDLIDHAHVLMPLSLLLPNQLHPEAQLTYAELWSLKKADLLQTQNLWPIENNTNILFI